MASFWTADGLAKAGTLVGYGLHNCPVYRLRGGDVFMWNIAMGMAESLGTWDEFCQDVRGHRLYFRPQSVSFMARKLTQDGRCEVLYNDGHKGLYDRRDDAEADIARRARDSNFKVMPTRLTLMDGGTVREMACDWGVQLVCLSDSMMDPRVN